ncbi:MAG: hypothetical protein IPG22_07160 [Acidobacteria bacterium]|nr:hypothetical protein [Acidobacteriota bacterium]
MNRLHLGIDYGTSASKLVLRHFEAAGGERAYLLEPNDRFRIPSAVSFDGETIRLNSDLQDALKSIKMRFAGDVTGSLRQHFYGELKNLPDRFSSGDLVTLTVWRLLSIGHLHAVKIVGSLEFKMGMSLGIPMSFLEDKVLRESYLYVARVAYHMYTNYGPIGSDTVSLTTARELLDGRLISQSAKTARAGSKCTKLAKIGNRSLNVLVISIAGNPELYLLLH